MSKEPKDGGNCVCCFTHHYGEFANISVLAYSLSDAWQKAKDEFGSATNISANWKLYRIKPAISSPDIEIV